MKSDTLRMELEKLVEKAGYSIRKERGTFTGDHCVMEGDKLVVMNTKRPAEQQVGLLARVLDNKKVNDIYVKPAVRKELDELWDRFAQFDEFENESKKSDFE